MFVVVLFPIALIRSVVCFCVCPSIYFAQALMRLAATAPFWSPAKHRICSMPVRSVVETVLQAALRFELSGGAGGLVPGEVWHGVLQALPWR